MSTTQSTDRPFAEVVTLEAFMASKNIQPSNLGIAKTTNGAIILTAFGSPVATIKKDLQGATPAETKQNLAAVNLCFGMPKAGSLDNAGRPSLPCAMASVSQWEEVSLF